MSKSKVKTNRVTGGRIAVMTISILLLALIMAFAAMFGFATLKQAKGPMDAVGTTVRKELPKDGTLPTESKPIDNIGYMAYVLDHQPSYHVYAENITVAMAGYKQTTRSWKDYKNAELSGVGKNVMVCSDLSYSTFVKSSSQSCFFGDNEAHIRSGSAPKSSSATPSDISWNDGTPAIYDKDGYKCAYGEFSTEISVYAINEASLERADDVVDNGDGTYSQKYYLNESAACWYQYGMKTRGDLRDYPEYKQIIITFTFDSKWQILSSYCEEKANISPRALGGLPMESTSKTTTTYGYGEGSIDNSHFVYLDYFKQYQGAEGSNSSDTEKGFEVFDILGAGFAKVLNGGQQFDIELTLGNTDYEGKVYLSLPDMGEILSTLDVRVALGKKGSGKQDLYVEFSKGTVNAYYSSDFALTCNIGTISTKIDAIKTLINGKLIPQPVALAAEEEAQSADFNLDSLMAALTLSELTDNGAVITLKSDNVLMGIGIDAELQFGRDKENDTFSIKGVELKSVEYNGTEIDLSVAFRPSTADPITRDTENTKADIADYADSVYALLDSNTIAVNIGLDGEAVEGLKLNAVSYVSIGSQIAATAEISAEYNGISLKLDATYIYEKTGYGKIYLHVSEINGNKVNAKVYCDIKDTADAVKNIIALFQDSEDAGTAALAETQDTLAAIINKVLNLNFSEIIGKVHGDGNSIGVDINVDELLSGLGVDIKVNFGTLSLTWDREPVQISGSVSGLGLSVCISGSENNLNGIDTDGYVDVTSYVNGVYSLLNKPSYDITVSLSGTKLTDKIDLSALTVNGTATVAVEGKTIRVKLPATVTYGDLSVTFTAYYTINISDGSYGEVYLHVTKFNEKTVNAKVYCDIKDAADCVKGIIARFAASNEISLASEQSDVLSKVVNILLNLDYNEIIRATDEKLTVKLDVDEILSNFDISLGGVTLGNLNLEFSPKTPSLNGSLEKLGLTVDVKGNDSALGAFDLNGYVELNAFLNGISDIVNSEVYKIGVEFVGGKITDKVDLSGINLDATVYAKLENGYNNVTVSASKVVISCYELEVELAAYYSADINAKNFSTVYLELKRIDETALNAKVYCDISDAIGAVKDIINSFNAQAATVSENEETADIISKLVGVVLNLDYSEIIKATKNNLSVTLNVDDVLSQLEISLGGIKFGNLQLDLTLSDKASAQLSGSIKDLGVTVDVKGNDEYKISAPNAKEYLDLTSVIRLVEKMISEGREIAEAKDIVFGLNGTATLGKVQVSVEGNGEVVWADSALKIAVSLSLTVDGNNLDINFVYDKDADKLVILTINDVGVEITKDEIDKLVNSFQGLIDAFSDDKTSEETDSTTEEENTEPDGTEDGEISEQSMEVGGYDLAKIAKNENVKKVLNALLGFVNEFTVQLDSNPSGIYDLILMHTGGVNVTLGADGCLSLEIAKAENKIYASVEAGNGATVTSILNKIAKPEEGKESAYTYYELSEFVKVLYDAFFKKAASLTEILGDNAYSVKLDLIGANSGLSVLEAVKVNAELYYGEGLVGTQIKNKLLHVDLGLTINGTYVEVTASYSGSMFYLELKTIGKTTFTGIKFKTDKDNVFAAVEQLVRLITDTNLVDTLNLFTGKGTVSATDTENIAEFASVMDENGESSTSALTKLIDALLSLNPNESFKFDSAKNEAVINLDSITEAVLNVKIGTITASCVDKTVSATVKTGENDAWLSFVAAACENRKDVINPEDYTDIGFISTLLSDLAGTITDAANNIHKLYTFTGNIVVNVNIPVLSQTINLNNATLTAGFDSNDKFYLTLAASLGDSAATTASDISVTYSDGLIVLGKGIEKDGKEFKVLTFEYFLDHVLDKKDSPAVWLLGTNETLWSIIMNFVKADIDSGLTKPQKYTLYKELEQSVKEGTFDLSDYLAGMCVNAGGAQSTYGNNAELAETKFDLKNDENHYAFDINAESLTGGILSKLCAVILRNDGGLSGLKAYGEISTYVDFTVNLGTYLEDETDLYGDVEEKTLGTLPVRNYLDYVTTNYGFDRNHPFEKNSGDHFEPVFGCFNTKDNSYASSDMLETIYLDVYDEDGKLERTLEVLYSSEVKLISSFPEFADNNNSSKLIYLDSLENGKKLPDTIVIDDSEDNVIKIIDGRVSIYKSSEEAIEVVFNFVDVDMKPVSAALSDGDKLADYEGIHDYTLLGWYEEESFETRVYNVDVSKAVDGKLNVYGKYIKTVVEDENGVIYTFDKVADGYFVSGTNEKVISKYYNNPDLWLKIAGEINKYPVKYIGKGAFANGDSENLDKSLVNVLVPESVTAVYDYAFKDNKALEKVVFLADNVFFGGRADSNGKTSTFYGCYVSVSNNVNTKFTVYYNGTRDNPYSHIETTNNEIDPAWNRIYFEAASISNLWTEKKYTMLAQQSGWTYADYVFDTDGIDLEECPYLEKLGSFVSGVDTTAYTAEHIRDIILNEINALTNENNSFIDGFEVSVSCGIEYGKAAVVKIVITEAQTRYYKIVYTGNVYLTGLVEYDGSFYAAAGASFAITPNDGFEVTKVEGVEAEKAEDGSYTFIMPRAAVEIAVDCDKIKFSTVTLISEIAYKIDEVEYAVTSEVNATEGDQMIGAPTATDSNYTFIGWAYKPNENSDYMFEGATVNYNVYYAVWAYKRAEIIGLSTSGLTLSATVDATIANSVYGWYTDEEITGTPILCENSSVTFTSVTSTVLYARIAYSLNVTVTTNNDAKFFYFTPDNWTKASSPTGDDCNNSNKSGTGKSFAVTIPVPENEAVCLEYNDAMDSYNCLKITAGEEVYYIRVKGGDDKSAQFTQINGDSSLSKLELDEMKGATTVTLFNNAAGSCVATGSLITLADGSKKRIEDLTGSEILLAWDFVSGTYVEAQIAFIFYHGEQSYDVVNLVFADNTVVKIIGEHAFYDYQLNDFVYLSKDNFADYIGHKFNKNTGSGYEFVELVKAYVTVEYTGSYSIQTVIYDNFFVEDMLSITPPMYEGLFFFFEYGDNMKYDEAKMQADIEEYGLFEYEELKEYIPQLTYEQFIAFNGAYLKVAVGKNLLTVEQIVEAAKLYLP